MHSATALDKMLFLCPATKKWRGIMLYPLKFWVSVSAPTILLPATPPTVFGHSFSNFTGLQDGLKICILFFQNPEIMFYHIFSFLT